MKTKIKLIMISFIALIVSLNFTYCIFDSSAVKTNLLKTVSYKIKLNGEGGNYNNQSIVLANNRLTLPSPTRKGYTFNGYSLTKDGNVIYSNEINNVLDINNKTLYARWSIVPYSISYDLNGGVISGNPTSYNVESSTFTLPQPTRTGYTFTGWTGSNGTVPQANVKIDKGTIGNKSFKANWQVNYYTVNYYVLGNLYAQRSVAYGNSLENINAQDSLDRFHKFNYWDGWVNSMPNYTVNLYANITESYCMLMTGHGPYGNASALLNVFRSAGWTGRIEEAPSAPGNYWVVTDYTLTREQAEIQKNYIANNTNYTNYNFPYLYWVAVSCTNGIGDTWTRSGGQRTFKSVY